ncbi:DEAD/DEAH box helicase family protein [Winogradskyella sp.]|uniref:DEAD/DEAH box helicase family protein n=1 Tax=Winogradskyella sp. TaxID=1883156 RepID=UPI0025E5679E|nr:DEAD/DEAH box helicase family protein [Winogradskyella sp.]MCT4628314.1 DEAD/DEAH box helicase family protein [Winogradskyella sp.]
MLESFSVLEFKFPWRSYQQTLLKNFDSHISDHHFHVIAPPGSGKTILGIEILRRIGKKTLVLAPTLTIRDQWQDRLQTFFTENTPYKSVSKDIKQPSDITFSTYQSLHSFYKSFENKDDFLDFFKSHNIETLVLDEAHHLKNAWWNCLIALKKSNPYFIVALTATPPYDSSSLEVNKYFTLCGEVDDEISVPSLIREKDLSPHQDFVYFSKPYESELHHIKAYRDGIVEFKNSLLQDYDFIDLLENHRFYKQPLENSDAIYSNVAFFSSILITLNEINVPIDRSRLEILGIHKFDNIQFPRLDLTWIETLLHNLLVTDRENLEQHETYLLDLEKQLRKLNVFEKNKVNLSGNEVLYKSLAFSPSKLESIVEIVNSERLSLNDDLSCVVLTDYVRKEFLSTSNQDIDQINKIGVLPIFHYIRTSAVNNRDLAVLTGSIVIVHHSIIHAINGYGEGESYIFTPLKSDDNFVTVTPSSKSKKTIVGVITKLFEDGIIKVLIGTKALLGEGWDAPSINSLILASFVGSFVSSNQMRGRAIRRDVNKPKKTSNIWHLACIDPTDANGGREIELLKRRFEAFVGVTNTKIPFITNGYERLDIPQQITADAIHGLNAATIAHSVKRNNTSTQWKQSIGDGSKLTRQLQLQDYKKPEFEAEKKKYYAKASRLVMIEIILILLIFFLGTITLALNLTLDQKLLSGMKLIGLIALAFFGHKLYKLTVYYLRHGFVHKKLKNMGLAILETMDEMNLLNTKRSEVHVHTEKLYNGVVICNLKGANNYEEAFFLKTLTELLEPVKSPRYIIISTNFFKKGLNIENFYPVPEAFGKNKKDAQLFYKYWLRYMGMSKLVFTRQPEGRRLLLKARLFHHTNELKNKLNSLTVWK